MTTSSATPYFISLVLTVRSLACKILVRDDVEAAPFSGSRPDRRRSKGDNFTSGATESNNLAIKGVANFYKEKKKHIITTQTDRKPLSTVISGKLTAIHTCKMDFNRPLADPGNHISVHQSREGMLEAKTD